MGFQEQAGWNCSKKVFISSYVLPGSWMVMFSSFKSENSLSNTGEEAAKKDFQNWISLPSTMNVTSGALYDGLSYGEICEQLQALRHEGWWEARRNFSSALRVSWKDMPKAPVVNLKFIFVASACMNWKKIYKNGWQN